jgi:hypothetical protein
MSLVPKLDTSNFLPLRSSQRLVGDRGVTATSYV